MRRVPAPKTATLVLSTSLVAFLLLSPARAEEDGAVAPAACWALEDGCAARTARALTTPLGGALETAWSWGPSGSSAGRIEEEPRVWFDRVFVACKATNDKRVLQVLHLHDGTKAALPRSFDTTRPLAPSVWQERVVVRAAPDRLEALVLRRRKLARIWDAPGEDFGAPVLLGDHVYVRDGDDVVCWRVGGKQPRWRASGMFRGRLSLCGPSLYALLYDDSGNAHLAQIDRANGRIRSKEFVGHHGPQRPPPRSLDSTIVVAGEHLFVQHATPVRTADRGRARTNWYRRRPLAGAPAVLSGGGLYDFQRTPVSTGERWLLLVNDKKGGLQLEHALIKPDGGGYKSALLASTKRQPRLLGVNVPYTVAGRTAYLGGLAFDTRSYDITWKRDGPLAFRPVPARGHLLVVPDASRLEALRPLGAGQDHGVFLGAAARAASPTGSTPIEAKGSIFFADWSVHSGAYRLVPDRHTIEIPRGRTKVDSTPLSQVHVALDGEGRLLFARDLDGISWAVATLVRRQQAKDYATLAGNAQRSNDPALMAQFIEEAASRGADERKIASLRTRCARLFEKKKRKRNEKAAGRVQAKARELQMAAGRSTLSALESALVEPRWPIRRHFLRQILARDPRHAAATKIVREGVPAFLEPPSPFDAAAWLEVVDALRGVPVRPVEVPAGKRERELTRQQRELGAGRHTWRKDLVGLESDQLLILTPLETPERVATCLSLGELTCRALEDVFASGEHVHTDRYPLVLQLFETQKEYETFAEEHGAKEDDLEHTAGHYDPASGVSRIFLPANRNKAFDEVMETYAHELTHHWIRERCPLFALGAARQHPKAPGFWIVEGMATFVEEFDWDLAAKTWRTDSPGAESLDVVASAKPGQLLPWKVVYDLSHIAFKALRHEAKHEVPMRWRLSWFNRLSEARMFYVQAGATCHFLYHAGDERRKQLLTYVRDYYTGALDEDERGGKHLSKRFGLSAEALGKAVVAYARERTSVR